MNSPRELHLLAIDLGAESGRALLGHLRGESLEFEEIHRFPNDPVETLGTLHWDVLRLFHEMRFALREAVRRLESTGARLDGISVDAWGVDYALLDSRGVLMGNPIHYRDRRLEGIQERVLSRISPDRIFEETGLQFLSLNTLFQLAAEIEQDPSRLERAGHLLFIPDLFHYFLTGVMRSEVSIASTSQLWNPVRREWSRPLLEELGLPAHLMPEVVPTGQVIGTVLPEIVETDHPPRVIAGACHDTGSAIAATPVDPAAGSADGTWAYLSSGTWSLMGVELDAPCITPEVREAGFTNEGGVAGTTRFLTSLGGLWLVQECRREWKRQGQALDYETLSRLAREAPPLRSLVPPDHDDFYSPGDMPSRIREFCRRTDQEVPGTPGEIVRCALESLALGYRQTARRLPSLTGKRVDRLHVLGGGSRNEFLNQLTADALAVDVLAGPAEATAIGNLLIQALALGELDDLAAIRERVRSSFEPRRFQPDPARTASWDEAARRFEALPR